jgi:hypothetical protein
MDLRVWGRWCFGYGLVAKSSSAMSMGQLLMKTVYFEMLSVLGLMGTVDIVLYLGAKKDWNENDQE